MDAFRTKATTQYTDWEGTVALDDPQEELDYDVLGLDGQRYSLIAVKAYHEWEAFDSVTAYCVDQGQLGDRTFDEFAKANGGRLPVVEIENIQATAEDIIQRFKRFEMILVHANWDVPEVEIVDTVDMAPGDDFDRVEATFRLTLDISAVDSGAALQRAASYLSAKVREDLRGAPARSVVGVSSFELGPMP